MYCNATKCNVSMYGGREREKQRERERVREYFQRLYLWGVRFSLMAPVRTSNYQVSCPLQELQLRNHVGSRCQVDLLPLHETLSRNTSFYGFTYRGAADAVTGVVRSVAESLIQQRPVFLETCSRFCALRLRIFG